MLLMWKWKQSQLIGGSVSKYNQSAKCLANAALQNKQNNKLLKSQYTPGIKNLSKSLKKYLGYM